MYERTPSPTRMYIPRVGASQGGRGVVILFMVSVLNGGRELERLVGGGGGRFRKGQVKIKFASLYS